MVVLEVCDEAVLELRELVLMGVTVDVVEVDMVMTMEVVAVLDTVMTTGDVWEVAVLEVFDEVMLELGTTVAVTIAVETCAVVADVTYCVAVLDTVVVSRTVTELAVLDV